MECKKIMSYPCLKQQMFLLACVILQDKKCPECLSEKNRPKQVELCQSVYLFTMEW